MISLFDRIQISRIQFQENDAEVLVNCIINQGDDEFETTLWIGFSDLNRLISKLVQLNDNLGYGELFQCIPMGQSGHWYEFDSKRFGLDNLVLEDLTFQQPIRQIRA